MKTDQNIKHKRHICQVLLFEVIHGKGCSPPKRPYEGDSEEASACGLSHRKPTWASSDCSLGYKRLSQGHHHPAGIQA